MSLQLMHAALDHACFDGRLRDRSGAWCWSDGEPEPRVALVPTRRIALHGHDAVAADGSALVQVPFALARAYDPLAWLRRGLDAGEFAVEIGSGAYRCVGSAHGSSRGAGVAAGVVVAVVPAWRWRSWCCVCAVAPAWSPSDEEPVFERARRLGWRG